MKINLKQNLKHVSGEDLKDQDGNPILLSDVAINAISAEGEEKWDGNKKMKMFILKEKIYNSDEKTNFEIEEIATIKEQIGKVYPTDIVGTAWRILEETNK